MSILTDLCLYLKQKILEYYLLVMVINNSFKFFICYGLLSVMDLSSVVLLLILFPGTLNLLMKTGNLSLPPFNYCHSILQCLDTKPCSGVSKRAWEL